MYKGLSMPVLSSQLQLFGKVIFTHNSVWHPGDPLLEMFPPATRKRSAKPPGECRWLKFHTSHCTTSCTGKEPLERAHAGSVQPLLHAEELYVLEENCSNEQEIVQVGKGGYQANHLFS